jgi:proteasome lid subunit RPN8/RPN11
MSTSVAGTRFAGTLHLRAEIQSALRAWSRDALPREACGFLLGSVRGARIEIGAALLASNIADREDRFEIAPGEIVAADRDARGRGLELVGFWHSHPRAGAIPSGDDARGAWPGHAYVIVGFDGEPSIRAWRRTSDVFVEDRVEASGGLHECQAGPQSASRA